MHVSPPFAEEVKVTLKVSQNLHASMTPYLLGAVLGKEPRRPAPGHFFDLENQFPRKATKCRGASQKADGATAAMPSSRRTSWSTT